LIHAAPDVHLSASALFEPPLGNHKVATVPAKPEPKQAQLIRKKPEQKLGDTPLEDFARRQVQGFHSTSADWASDPLFIEKTESVSISR
jgi:hypothetical protein